MVDSTADLLTQVPAQELFDAWRRRTRVVDLSPLLHTGMPTWSTHPDAIFIQDARSHDKDGYFAQTLLISEHTGAHVDAAHHFHRDLPEATVDAYRPDQLIGRFALIDLRPGDFQPGRLVTAAEVEEALAARHVALEPGDVALVCFGWEKHYKPDHPDPAVRAWWSDNAPGLAEDACALLAGRGISAIGSDTAACDVAVVDGEMKSDFGHRTYFLPRGIPIIEGLANLEGLPASGVFFAAPLRIRGGSGSPLRPLAFIENGVIDA